MSSSEIEILDEPQLLLSQLYFTIKAAMPLQPEHEIYLCDPRLIYFGSNRFNRGWSCGYNNALMVWSVLQRNLRHLERIETIQKMQERMEEAWKQGFDVAGAEQLNHQLVGTTTWIGATEIAALCRSHHLKATIIDFHRPTGPGRTHPDLFKYVANYFKEMSLLEQNSKCLYKTAPIYLQHQGHSRTIVGVILAENQVTSLIVLDPDQRPEWPLVKISLHQLRHNQYQLVTFPYLDRNQCLFTSDTEWQESRILRSIRIPL